MVNESTAGALFEQYIAAGLAYSLLEVQANGDQLPKHVCVQARHLLSFALRVPSCWPAARDLLLAIDPPMQVAGYREPWLGYLLKGLACAEQAGDQRAAAQLHLAAGELQRHMGHYGVAEAHFHAALALSQADGDLLLAAAAEVGLANLALLREEWQAALGWCQDVLRQIPSAEGVRARALFVAASVHASRHEDGEAERLYRQAEAVWETVGSPRWVALCRQNQARMAARGGEHGAARSLYRSAHAILDGLGVPHSLAVVQMNWGIVEYLEGNLPDALALYQEAEAIFRRLQDRRYLAMICNNIGLLYRHNRQWQAAEAYYAESIHLWRELGATLARISVEIDLGKLWLDCGEAQQAGRYFAQLLAELQRTDRDAEHRRLYAELQDYMAQALAQGWLDERLHSPNQRERSSAVT